MIDSLVIRLAVKVFPLRTPYEGEGPDLNLLQKKYLPRALAEIVVFLIIAPLLVRILQVRFVAHSQSFTAPATATYALTTDPGFWYVPASFLGVVLACVLIHLGNRLLLSDGGREYRYWFDARIGFAASKLFLTVGIVVAAGGFALAHYAAQSHMVFTPTGLIFQKMWSMQEEQHPYSDIRALKQVMDADGQSSEFRIEFNDAEPWTTAEEEIFPEAEHKAFLEHVTGKRIEVLSK